MANKKKVKKKMIIVIRYHPFGATQISDLLLCNKI